MQSRDPEDVRRRIERLDHEIARLKAERERSLAELGRAGVRAPTGGEPSGFAYRFATASDDAAVRALLARCALPSEDVAVGRQELLVAERGGAIVGTAGLEMGGAAALLRSVAVDPAERRAGVARALCDRALAHAARRRARTVYLLTTTAEAYFNGLGFERVDRSAVPEALQSSAELRSLCPTTVTCMARGLSNRVHHYPADLLPLRPDVAGASMWAVALDRAMLTYFEVEPNGRFDLHAHESEQITFVLEGELVFETEDGRAVAVRAGEAIAVPSNVPHAVSTRERAARALDAWAPVRDDYR